MKRLTIPVFLLLAFVQCDSNKPTDQIKNQESSGDLTSHELAITLSRKFIITDGHIDLPYKLVEEGYMRKGEIPDLSKEINGQFDFVKAKHGGLDAPFMSIFLPAKLQKTNGASKTLADSLIDMVGQIVDTYPQHFARANSPEEVTANFQKGLISLPMGMENGSGIEDDLNNVQYFFDRGIRYITLTHGKDNRICDSSYDTTHTWNGLSPFGKEVVRGMNRVGIMVDISHVSDSTFYQVMAMTDVPCIASHSSVRKFVPGFERNMSDDMIKLLASKQGVIQINFGSTFLLAKSRNKGKALDKILVDFRSKNPKATKTEITAFEDEWMANNDFYANVTDVADHIDHVVKLVGIDYVGLGSDFDGVDNTLPVGLKTAEDYPNLIAILIDRGYSEQDIEKICYKNVFRVWTSVLDTAEKKSNIVQ